jgi:Tol biopolymer transport system component
MPLSSGTKLGPYEILSPIGAGGMGEVYRARDTRLEREVAVKVLPGHLSEHPELRQRLDREARVISGLSHPHICTLFDVGHENGIDFLVMEFLEGETLARRLEAGPLPPEEALRIGIQVATALDRAHRTGVVHRDLKPGNVMLTRSGVKLLDFGLAKMADTAAVPAGSALSQGATEAAPSGEPLTERGTVLGTFQYMAPEQLEGEEADARSDLFALGTILYEMATGRKAFEGSSQASLVAAILKEQPRAISEVQPLAPPALDRLVRACLAKDPEDRIQTAHDAKLQLQWIAEGGSQAGVPRPVAARRRKWSLAAWGLAGLFAATSVALGVIVFRNASIEPSLTFSSIPPPAGAAFELSGIHPGPVAVSPDGRRLAFTARDDHGHVLLHVRDLDEPTARALPGTDGAGYPFWSPDSRRIAFFADGRLKKVDASGGPPPSLCEASRGKGGTWSREDVILFAPSFNSAIQRISASGGEPIPVTKLDVAKGDNSHRFPWFLPDGEHFLYFVRGSIGQEAAEGNAVMLGSIAGEEPRPLLWAQSNAMYASGHLLFVRESSLMAQPFDAGALELSGEAFPVAERVHYIPGAMCAIFSASLGGELVYLEGVGSPGSRIVWLDRKGEETGELGDRNIHDEPSLSPDGEKVAVPIYDQRTGTPDLWVYEVERGLRTRFTFDPGADLFPVWSPDGTRIAYSSTRNGPFDLYQKSFTGSSGPEPLLESKAGKWLEDWSPDGRYLAYTEVSEETGNDIWILPMEEGGKPTLFLGTSFDEFDAALSPDGHWIAYASDESGQIEVYITSFPAPGRKWQISSQGGLRPIWTREGREIIYQDLNNNRVMAVDLDPSGSTLGVGRALKLFDLSSSSSFDVTLDGERFLVISSSEEQSREPLTLVQNWTRLFER